MPVAAGLDGLGPPSRRRPADPAPAGMLEGSSGRQLPPPAAAAGRFCRGPAALCRAGGRRRTAPSNHGGSPHPAAPAHRAAPRPWPALSWRSITCARADAAARVDSCIDICWSSSDWYMRVSSLSNMPPLGVASRIDLSICWTNRASNWRAASLVGLGELSFTAGAGRQGKFGSRALIWLKSEAAIRSPPVRRAGAAGLHGLGMAISSRGWRPPR